MESFYSISTGESCLKVSQVPNTCATTIVLGLSYGKEEYKVTKGNIKVYINGINDYSFLNGWMVNAITFQRKDYKYQPSNVTTLQGISPQGEECKIRIQGSTNYSEIVKDCFKMLILASICKTAEEFNTISQILGSGQDIFSGIPLIFIWTRKYHVFSEAIYNIENKRNEVNSSYIQLLIQMYAKKQMDLEHAIMAFEEKIKRLNQNNYELCIILILRHKL